MTLLRVAEGCECDEPSNLGGIVVLDGRLEMLALRRRLPQLAAQPAQQAHGRLIGNVVQAIAA